MIEINKLYDTVTKYLVLKGKGGYGTNAQFNDDVRRCQTMLQNYYINRYAESSIIEESLSTFIQRQTIVLTSDIMPKPVTFRHKISAKYQYTINNADFSNSSLQEFPLIELRANEWDATHNSVIRGANKEKERGYYRIVGDEMQFSFNKGTVIMTFITKPPTAVRQVTLDVATDNENFNGVGTINLAWNESDENNLIDIMLWFKGIQIRESEIMNWVVSSKQLMK